MLHYILMENRKSIAIDVHQPIMQMSLTKTNMAKAVNTKSYIEKTMIKDPMDHTLTPFCTTLI